MHTAAPAKAQLHEAAVSAALQRCATLIDSLIYLANRHDARPTTEAERAGARAHRTHVVGEPFAFAIQWTHNRCDWQRSIRGGAELWDYVAQAGNKGLVDASVRDIVVPQLHKLETPEFRRAFWLELFQRFPHVASEHCQIVEGTMSEPTSSSPEAHADTFRIVANRLHSASSYSDTIALTSEEGALVEQAGRLLEQAARSQVLNLPDCLDGWLEEFDRKDDHTWREHTAFLEKVLDGVNARVPFTSWLLIPHVRFFSEAVDEWLVPKYTSLIRKQGRGVGHIDTGDHHGEAGIAYWRSRLQTFGDSCLVLSQLIDQLNDGPTGQASMSPRSLYEALQCSADSLRKFAINAGTRTPGRGQRNFRYTDQDIAKILDYAVRHAGTQVTRKCAASMIATRKPK